MIVFEYFVLLVVSVVIAASYYATNRKTLNLPEIAIASIVCYIMFLALTLLILQLQGGTISCLFRYEEEGILFFIPLIMGINIPLFVIVITRSRKTRKEE